jgi:hypothetical protein
VAAVTGGTGVAPPTSVPGPAPAEPAEAVPPPSPPPPAPQPEIKEAAERREGEVLSLNIAASVPGNPDSFKSWLYTGPGTIPDRWPVELRVDDLLNQAKLLDDAADFQQANRILANVGARLFREALPDKLQNIILYAAATKPRRRLLIDLTEGPALSRLPWEALYISERLVFPVLKGDLSVVRYLPGGLTPPPVLPARDGTVTMLAVLANPIDTAPIAGDAALILSEGLGSFPVRLQVLSDQQGHPVTLEAVYAALVSMRPDIFFFLGHADGRVPEMGEVGVLLSDKDGKSELVAANRLERFFSGTGVSLAVLMGADTPDSNEAEWRKYLAERFVRGGVPAAIGSVRPISKSSALIFTRTFFPSLFNTGDIETAMTEARKALADHQVDWSPYALFSSVSQLENLRFLAPPAV